MDNFKLVFVQNGKYDNVIFVLSYYNDDTILPYIFIFHVWLSIRI